MSENNINYFLNKFIKSIQETGANNGAKGAKGNNRTNENESIFQNDGDKQESETLSLSDLTFDDSSSEEYGYDTPNSQEGTGSTKGQQGNTNSSNNAASTPNTGAQTNFANNRVSPSANTGTSTVSPVNLTGNETLDELKSNKADIEEQISETEEANAAAIETAQGEVEAAQTAYDEAIESAESQDEEIQAQLDDIQSRKEENEAAVSEQEGVVDGIKTDISEKEDEINTINSDISSKESDISNIEGELSSIGDSPNKESYAQTDAQGNISYPGYAEAKEAYDKRKKELEDALAKAKEELAELEENLATAEAALSELENSLTEAETSLSNLQTQGTEIDNELSQLLSEQGNNIEGAEQLQAALQAYNEAQQNLAEVESQQGNNINVQQLQSNLSAIDAAIQKKEAEEASGTSKEEETEGTKQTEQKAGNSILNTESDKETGNKMVIGFSTGINSVADSAKELAQRALEFVDRIKEGAEGDNTEYSSDRAEEASGTTKATQTTGTTKVTQSTGTTGTTKTAQKTQSTQTTGTTQSTGTTEATQTTGTTGTTQATEQEECLIDPIGIDNNGVRYDFIVDDGDFDSIEDFLGSSDAGIQELIDLDADNDGTVSGSELSKGDIMVVRTAADGSQTMVSIADVEAELGGNISIDLSSIKPAEDAESDEAKAKNKNFNVNITDANGDVISTYDGYSEYIKTEDFDKYDYSIDDAKIGDIKDNKFKEIVYSATTNGIPENIAITLAKESIIEHLNSNNNTDEEVTIEEDDQGYYVIVGGENDGMYLSQVITEDDLSNQITRKYEDYLRAAEPEKYALANTIYDNPNQASRLLIQSYGGDGEAAAAALQEGFNNYNGTTTGLFEDVSVRYDSETGEILITNSLVNNGLECSLSMYIEKCQELDQQAFYSKIHEITFKNVLINNSSEIQPVEQEDDAIRCLTNANTIISEDIDGGTQLTQALYNAETKEDAYDVLLTYCGNNKDVADKVYSYLYGEGTQVTSDKNPFYNRDVSSLIGILYTNVGNKYVLNQNLLNQFTETEIYGYEEVENEDEIETVPLSRPVKEYYTNLNGELCTRNWTYTQDGERENIKITLEENDSTREIEFYTDKNSANETIYYIKPKNDNEEPIAETQDEFFRRLAVAQNYSVLQATDSDLMQNGFDMSTEKIAQYYQILVGYDRNTAETLSTISRQFSSEGLADDARNWLSKTFKMGLNKDDVLSEVEAQTLHTVIMSYYINGQDDIAQEMVQGELERRLNNAESYQEIYDELYSYYQDENTVLAIMNSSIILPQDDNLKEINPYFDFDADNNLRFYWNTELEGQVSELASYCGVNSFGFIDNSHVISLNGTEYANKTLTKEQAYTFLSNGGEYTPENVQTYEKASEAFTDYNTAIAAGTALEECKSPEDAFYLITGKKIDDPTLSDEDIQKFNDIYDVNNAKSFYEPGHGDYKIGCRYDREKGFQISYYEEGFEDIVYESIDNIEDSNNLPGFISSLLSDDDQFEYINAACSSNIEEYKQQKFNEFYEQNRDTVNQYISSYSKWAASDPDSLKHFAEVMGVNKDELTPAKIAVYLKTHPEARYNESCKYMQYAYTTSKQQLFGESRLDNITNQYCMDMATYSSNLSHMLSMGCMIGSVLFPAAAPALMMGAKISGYVDNAIDLVNMLTNRQNYLDDDYLGWAKSTGFEYLTKRGYMAFSNIAGDKAQDFTEWIIDNTKCGSFFAGNAVAQILLRGSSEAIIETGICIPWTMAIKAIQGGEYNLGDELKENFIYDFLPYARGWQDMLIGKVDQELYAGNGTYYRVQNSDEIVKIDPDNGRILGIYAGISALQNDEKPLVSYNYLDGGKVVVTEYKPDGSQSVRIQENNGNKITYCDSIDNEGNPVNPTKTVIAEQNYDGTVKITTTEKGKSDLVEIRDAKGRTISIEQDGVKTVYNPKTGKKETMTYANSSGQEITVNYKNTWGSQTATVKINGEEYSYEVGSDGLATFRIESEDDNDRQFTVDEKTLLSCDNPIDAINKLVMMESENAGSAEKFMNDAAKLNPENPEEIRKLLLSCNNPADAFDKLSQMDNPQKFLDDAAKLNPENPEDAQRLLLSCDNSEEIQKLLLGCDNPADAFDKLSQMDNPQKFLDDAAKLNPENPEDAQRLLLSCDNPEDALDRAIDNITKMQNAGVELKPSTINNIIALTCEKIDVDKVAIENLASKEIDLSKIKDVKDKYQAFKNAIILCNTTEEMNLTNKAIRSLIKSMDRAQITDAKIVQEIGKIQTEYLSSNLDGDLEYFTSLKFTENFDYGSEKTIQDSIKSKLRALGLPKDAIGELAANMTTNAKYDLSDVIWSKMTEEQRELCREAGWGDNGQALITHMYGKSAIEDGNRYTEISNKLNEVFPNLEPKIDMYPYNYSSMEDAIVGFSNGANQVISTIEEEIERQSIVAVQIENTKDPNNQYFEQKVVIEVEGEQYPCYKKTCTDSNGVEYVWYVIDYGNTGTGGSKTITIAMHDGLIDTCMMQKKRNYDGATTKNRY